MPLGTLATAVVLGRGISAFHKGQKNMSQKMMRMRVVMQGITVAAICFGASLGFTPHSREKTYEEKFLKQQNSNESSGRN